MNAYNLWTSHYQISTNNTKKRATKQTDTHATNAQNEVRRLQAGAAYIHIREFRDGQL